MRTRILLFMTVVLAALSLGGIGVPQADPPVGPTGPNKILTFGNMYGVDGPFVDRQVRGVPGDELPWVVEHARGVLKTNGQLTIHVRGLVFKDDPSVPEDLRGKNDEAQFRGLVSCLTEGNDEVVGKNIFTSGFPATTSGNADISEKLALPQPCLAPIIMVLAGSEDKWFAMTGFEAEEEEED
jgi:hypothetical protein